MRERPSARAAISKARCEIDLSPGARSLPVRGLPPAGSTCSFATGTLVDVLARAPVKP